PGAAAAWTRAAVFIGSPATIPSCVAPSVTDTCPVTTPPRAASPGTSAAAPGSAAAPATLDRPRTPRAPPHPPSTSDTTPPLPTQRAATLPATRVPVHPQPPQHLDVPVAERGAAGRHGGRHTGQMAGHDVGVALNDNSLPALRDVPLGQVRAVQHRALLEQR